MKILELGNMVKDTVSATKGMLTHFTIDMGGNERYIFQPQGLNPKTGQPVEAIWVERTRITGAKEVEVDLPLNVLGTQGEDMASGFKGTICEMIYHINGCLHVEIKPKGTLTETGGTIAAKEFDIRRVKGEAITPLNEKQLKESIKDKPSPMPAKAHK